MALLLFSPRVVSKNKPHQPLAVRHIAMPVATVTAPARATSVAPSAKSAPKPTAKKSSQPQPSPKKQPAVQNSALASLAKELEKTLAHMQTGSEQRSKPSAWQKTVLQIDAPEESTNDYVPLLTHFLHTALHLPDFGAVKMQLTVRRDGSVVKLLVLKTESEENRKYLEKQIPLLRFPPLQGEYAKKGEHVFVLTFCNEL